MHRIPRIAVVAVLALASVLPLAAADLEARFADPPQEARARVWWLWLHSNTSKSRITYDIEEMKKKGIGGFLQWDPGPGPSRYGTRADELPPSPAWMSTEWRDALRHALAEAGRLGLEASIALTPGPNCGGPWITPELSAQRVVIGGTSVTGPRRFSEVLALPDGVARGADGRPLHYKDIAVFAAEPSRVGHGRGGSEVSQLYPTASLDNVEFGSPWVDITDRLDASGRLTWDVPPGMYRILRIGHTSTGQHADYFRPEGAGLLADHMNPQAVEVNFRTMLKELFGAGPLPPSLKYIHCDSYEIYGSDWTPGLLDEFRRRRGYDPTPFLPTLDGGNVKSRAVTARFRADLDRTRADCFAEYHYQRLYDLAHSMGLKFHSESAGPRVIALDALEALGRNDYPMGEFWLEADTHRVTPEERFYVKMTATAAHVYGKRYAAMEAFTNVGRHWEEDPWSLKPSGDQAFLEGANLLYIHTFTHSPEKFGKPGIEYFAGSHINPNITWWEQSRAWFDYLARCQMLLSEGLFVADVLYFYGDQVPAYVQSKHVDPSLGAGYDYDVTNGEVIRTRMSVKDGRIALPDGMSYRVLVMPEGKPVAPETLRKIEELVKAGATVVGPPPTQAPGLANYQARDEEVKAIARRIWGAADVRKVTENRYGRGRAIWGPTLREVLLASGIGPDFTYTNGAPGALLDAIHRRTDDSDIYFVVNKRDRWENVNCAFRSSGRALELWDPSTGARRAQLLFRAEHGRTVIPMRLAPLESVFVVFRGAPPSNHAVELARQGGVASGAELVAAPRGGMRLRAWESGSYTLRDAAGRTTSVTVTAPPPAYTIESGWRVRFAPGWGAPESAVFPKLVSWTERAEDGIKYFSGAATYETVFDAPRNLLTEGRHLELDLGAVANLAEVRLNGRDLGVVWKPPFQVDVTGLVQAAGNRLEVKVVNLWVNRMIGDEKLPEARRYTHANMHKFTASSPLRASGLLGPVRLRAAREMDVKWPVRGEASAVAR
jgi:hypothetical protein